MFRIGEFSKMAKTTIKTLHYYDGIGLLKSEETDPITGYRHYSTKQLVKLHRIQALRQIGLSIDEIKLIMDDRNVETLMEKRRAELLKQLDEIESQLSRIEFILKEKEEENFMSYVATSGKLY